MAMTAGGRVWDGPTRIFHWLLVGLLAYSWWTAGRDPNLPPGGAVMQKASLSRLIAAAAIAAALAWWVNKGLPL
jgi:cytochrome b